MTDRTMYLVTQTRQVRVDAASAAEARQLAETIFQLKPNSKVVLTKTHVEKVKN